MTVLEELKQDLKETIIVAENELKEINDTEIRFRVNSFVKTILEKIIKEIDNEYIPKEKQQIEKSYLEGFKISGEGYNGEHPFEGYEDFRIIESIKPEEYYNKL